MKMMKRLSAVLLVALVLCTMTVPALAMESSVTYEKNRSFTVKSGSEFTATDMFDEFKGVMPGDTLTETIEVKVAKDFKKADYVKVFLKAVPHDAVSNLPTVAGNDAEFLKQLTLVIEQNGKELYRGAPEEGPNSILLGSLRKGKSTTLDVSLIVPITMGNEFADKIGEVDWVFTAEEHNVPKTGDDTNVVPYVAALCVSVVAIVVILVVMKKRKQES